MEEQASSILIKMEAWYTLFIGNITLSILFRSTLNTYTHIGFEDAKKELKNLKIV